MRATFQTPAANFIAGWEGLHKVKADGLVYPYRDVAGVLTVGYGFTHRGLVASAPHTPERMARVLEWLTDATEAQALRLSPILLRSAEPRRTAITSFVFNLGAGAYQASTLRRAVNAGDWTEAAFQIKRWVYAGGRPVQGLRNRREAEAALLLLK